MGKYSIKIFLLVSLFTLHFSLYTQTAYAIVDPLSVPNNKFGIHIITASPDESSPAASLVNTNGDWGYVTFLIESKDRNESKWQEFFNDLRRRHLIPIVRLATKPLNGHWERPYEKEYEAWADFLDKLNWPTKNRYVVIFNEPNHAKEWGNQVDAKSYAEILDQTITALKNKNRDFFVLNGGFDASAPSKLPLYQDQLIFMQQMNQAVPGIFNKLDGWVSHSYPNPGFVGSPYGAGRGTVRTWYWELQQLKNFGVTKNLPVFITETGWKHAEGLKYDPALPSTKAVSNYFKTAFETAWVTSKIVAVTPFLLTYQENPFDHFSFKSISKEKQISEFYPQYKTIMDLPKIQGNPVQENKAKLLSGEVFSSIVAGENYHISLTFKNSGQSIWNDPSASSPRGDSVKPGQVVKLVPIQAGKELGIDSVELPQGIKIEPGQDYTFNFRMKAPEKGIFKVIMNLFAGGRQFDSAPLEFTTEVKLPVILIVKNSLQWKNNFSGEYFLTVTGAVDENTQKITVNKLGNSQDLEARYLLPDYIFDFTLQKEFYKPKTLRQTVHSGINILDFESLRPDLLKALLHPLKLWKLLPFSN